MENNTSFISPLEINMLKAMYYDVQMGEKPDLHAIAALLDDEYNYDCGVFLTRSSILADLHNIITDLQKTSSKNTENKDEYHEKGPKLSRFTL